MGFRVGQKVMLIDNNGMSAPVGATAIIECIGEKRIGVTWLTHSESQMNGEYYPFHFKPLLEKGKQLEFSFMG